MTKIISSKSGYLTQNGDVAEREFYKARTLVKDELVSAWREATQAEIDEYLIKLEQEQAELGIE